MALKTTYEQLVSVQSAIERIESGAQQMSYEDRLLKFPELDSLYKREYELKRMYKAEQGTGGIPAFNRMRVRR